MKRIILITPDQIDRTTTTRSGNYNTTVEITPDTIKKMLNRRENYHEDYHFQDLDKVKIVSIEDC